jgi:hypothetical protein
MQSRCKQADELATFSVIRSVVLLNWNSQLHEARPLMLAKCWQGCGSMAELAYG